MNKNQFHEVRKSIYKFHKEKNQPAISFTYKNQQATSSMNKIGFTRRKIKVKVSRREKSKCNKFHEQKLAGNKFHEQNQSQVKKSQ